MLSFLNGSPFSSTGNSFNQGLRILAIALSGVANPNVRAKTQPTDLADLLRQDRQRVQLIDTKDGVVFGLIGQENESKSNPQNPMYVILGVGSDPSRTYEGAIALSKATGRSVQPVMNASGVVEARKLWENRFVLEIPAADKISSWVGEALRNFSDTAAELDGRIEDIARATVDRNLPAKLAVEPSTRTLSSTLLNDLIAGKRVDIVSHSQGTVIVQNSLVLLVNDLEDMVRKGVLSDAERLTYLSSLRIFATGTYAAPDLWPAGISVKNLNNPDDLVSKVGGSLPTADWSNLDFSLESHSFSGYVSWISAELKGAPWCGPASANLNFRTSLTDEERALLRDSKQQAEKSLGAGQQVRSGVTSILFENGSPVAHQWLTAARNLRSEVNKKFNEGCQFASELVQTETHTKFESYENFELEPGELQARVLIQGCVNACCDLNESYEPFLVSAAGALRSAGANGDAFLTEARAVKLAKSGEIGSIFWKVAKELGKEKLQELVFREVSGFANNMYCTKDSAEEFALKRYTVNNRIAPTMMKVLTAPTDEEAERILTEFEKDRETVWTDFKNELKKCWSPSGSDTPLTSAIKKVEETLKDYKTKAQSYPTPPGSTGGSGPSLRPSGPEGTPSQSPQGPIPIITPGIRENAPRR